MKTGSRFWVRAAACALAICLSATVLFGADSDRRYSLELMGQPCGELHSTETTKDGKITSVSSMKFQMGRGDIRIDVTMETTFVETEAGKPVMMRAVKKLAAKPITETYTFNEDGTIELVSEQDGQRVTKTLPKPEGVWLTPAAAERFMQQRQKSGAKEIVIRSIDPSAGVEPVTATYSDFEKVELTIEGRTIDALKRTVKTKNSAIPVGTKSTEYVDEDGTLVKSRVSMGMYDIDTVLTTKSTGPRAGAMAEIMVSTFVKPDKAIKDPRHSKKTVLLLSVPDDAIPTFPSTGSQQVESVKPTSARLTITAAGGAPAADADVKNGAYLASTVLANTTDELIQRLAANAVERSDPTPQARAEACREYVNTFIVNKNLNVGFASASEIAKTREGDCTEHGVLLAALLRANGVPARCAVGLIYAEEFSGKREIFGYHMWAQALLTINGKPTWVDLDATLGSKTPFDATHITLDTTDLADGSAANGLGGMITILGRLKINVEHAE